MPESQSHFDDCDLAPKDILGTTTFKDVLYTPEEQQPAIEEAKAFAKRDNDSDYPERVVTPVSGEQQHEMQCQPYGAAAFFHFNLTGSLQKHRAYLAAFESPNYDIEFDTDYESGDLTITVTKTDS
mgnify:CR=1 FL=1